MKLNQYGFIQIPILIAIAIGAAFTGGAGVTLLEYRNVSNKIVQSNQLSAEENYATAIDTLEVAKKSWLVSTLGIKKGVINDDLSEIETRQDHLDIYQKALNQLDKKELEQAITSFSEIPDNSFYHQRAQLKIEESKRGILEGKLAVEQTARKTAEAKTKEEIVKRNLEEVARKNAEQIAASERMAKEQKQLEVEVQTQLAVQQEKSKYLELARTNPLIKAIVSGELNFYIEPIPSYAASGVSSTIEVFAKDFDEWEPYGASIKRVYSENAADLTVGWVRDYGSHTLGESIFKSHIKIGLGSNNCRKEWSAFDASTVGKIFWHELGHSVGYGHSNDTENIMYDELSTRFDVDYYVSKVISGGWYSTTPFCDGGTYSYSFSTDSASSRFDIFVLPPGQDAYEFSGGSGRYIPSCSEENVRTYSKSSCTVASGAQIYILNTSSTDAIRLTGKVIDLDMPEVPDMDWDEDAFKYDETEMDKIWSLFH